MREEETEKINRYFGKTLSTQQSANKFILDLGDAAAATTIINLLKIDVCICLRFSFQKSRGQNWEGKNDDDDDDVDDDDENWSKYSDLNFALGKFPEPVVIAHIVRLKWSNQSANPFPAFCTHTHTRKNKNTPQMVYPMRLYLELRLRTFWKNSECLT